MFRFKQTLPRYPSRVIILQRFRGIEDTYLRLVVLTELISATYVDGFPIQSCRSIAVLARSMMTTNVKSQDLRVEEATVIQKRPEYVSPRMSRRSMIVLAVRYLTHDTSTAETAPRSVSSPRISRHNVLLLTNKHVSVSLHRLQRRGMRC
jgi:hypothetical protein